MKRLATLTVLFGLLIASFGASAASPQYPPEPMPPYAAEELQKVVDGLSSPSGSLPEAPVKSAVKPEGAADESHAAVSVQKHPNRAQTNARRHSPRKLV